MIGAKKNLIGIGSKIWTEITEGLLKTKLVIEDGIHLDIWSVYNNNNLKKIWQGIEEDSYCENHGFMLAGDFNIRIGEEGRCLDFDSPGEIKKIKSKDKVLGKIGKELAEKIENNGWMILNGAMKGDEAGEYTFVGGRRQSVIDYAIINEEVWNMTKSFKVIELSRTTYRYVTK